MREGKGRAGDERDEKGRRAEKRSEGGGFAANGLLRGSPFESRCGAPEGVWDREEGSIKMPEITYIFFIFHFLTLEYFISPSIFFF